MATKNVLEVDPDNEDANQIKGGTLLAVGHHALDNEDWQTATDSLIEAYSINPACGDLPEKLAHCAEKGGLLPRAIEVFETRLKEESGDLAARQLAGRSYVNLVLATNKDALAATGMTQDEVLEHAERHLSYVTQHDPDNVGANYWLAFAYCMMAQVDKAWEIVDILRTV
jgi:Tfp pilus assembly protein PilF